jgi:lyso-ornithine lipid O-acyltransferase
MAQAPQDAPTPPSIELPGVNRWGGPLRAIGVLTAFFGLTLPLMPVQWLFLALSPTAARTFPHWYHRRVCRLLGIRLHIDGAVPRDMPVLLISNHVSWLDIPVISAVAPVSFIAKREVGTWPFVSWLAKLQRTIFIDRTRRADIPVVAAAMRERLAQDDALVLFAEGTSSDGNRVLPFKSSLLAIVAAKQAAAPDDATGKTPKVQTLSLVYTHIHGVPLSRADRNLIGWYGDMEMGGHAWSLLKSGPIDVAITVSDPVDLDDFTDRKELSRHAETLVRKNVSDALRARTPRSPDPANAGDQA